MTLGREPEAHVLDFLQDHVAEKGAVEYLLELANCPEALDRRSRMQAAAPLFVPPGHYYSPVVDPAALRASGHGLKLSNAIAGVQIDWDPMQALFERLAEQNAGLEFPQRQHPAARYYADNDMFCLGDAFILACMVRHLRPRRYVEVGSGFSSAVVLDTLDRTPDLATACTFIEPYTERLESLLRPADQARTTIIRCDVQNVPLDVFRQLGRDDILFLDTTHVSKTGSDVNHELFEILPVLASGVVVHFHDIFLGFEYPDQWVFDENRSWNEAYLLRAFLMYNDVFEIMYANNAFGRARPKQLERVCSGASQSPGSGFWLRKR
ncbi:MAG: class I SAM-dependent methyltransferase [Acetobacteraceae bacterium]|nr:class I SAM-dependent methyltransferase [Acetobacteraceae bacterium]